MVLFIVLTFAALTFIAGLVGFSGTAGTLARLSKMLFIGSFTLLVIAFLVFFGLDKTVLTFFQKLIK